MRLGVGIAGWGTAGQLMAVAMARNPQIRFAGVADPDPRRLAQVGTSFDVSTFDSVTALLEAGDVDAVYVASPTPSHARAITECAARGVHVLVEKPFTADLDEALRACSAAEHDGVRIVVGATHSGDAPIRALRHLVVTGSLGSLQSVHSMCHTDWRKRPRTPVDLDASAGGGLVLRQGSHQFDVLRYLAGGLVERVSGTTFGGSDGGENGYAALLQFADGATASAHYSGAGGFDTRLLTHGVGELGSVETTSALEGQFFRLGGDSSASPMFGFTTATFEHGEAVVTPAGLLVWDRGELSEVRLEKTAVSGWDAALVELMTAARGDEVVRTGRWGTATLETCLAVHQSHQQGAAISLTHQVPAGREGVPTPTEEDRT